MGTRGTRRAVCRHRLPLPSSSSSTVRSADPSSRCPPAGARWRGAFWSGFQDDASLRWAADRADMLDRRPRCATQLSSARSSIWEATAPTRPADAIESVRPRLPARRCRRPRPKRSGARHRASHHDLGDSGVGERRTDAESSTRRSCRIWRPSLRRLPIAIQAGIRDIRPCGLFSAWNEPEPRAVPCAAVRRNRDGRSGRRCTRPSHERSTTASSGATRDALVAIGETSPRGHDRPSRGGVQDSHSPARFARCFPRNGPAVAFDAWAQHPYPPRPDVAPDSRIRWPRVGLGNLERFGESRGCLVRKRPDRRSG